MKKVILAGIIFMMFMGVVSASSINGTFEENPIVKIFNNGNLIVPTDVPAIIYKGRTMVPMSLLKSIGVGVEWDKNTYSVRVSMPSSTPSPTPAPAITISSMARNLKSQGVSLINYMTDGSNINTITFYTDYSSVDGANKNSEFSTMLSNGILTDSDIIEVYYIDKQVFSVPTSAVKDFVNGKIDGSALQKFYKYENDNAASSGASNGTVQSTPSPQQSNQVQATPQPTSVPVQNNAALCTSIKQSQALALFNFKETQPDPFGGSYQADLSRFEQMQAQELAANGCS